MDPERPLGAEPPLEVVLSSLEPHAATPRASTPQHPTASIDLRKITSWISLIVCRRQRPSAPPIPCYRQVADLLTSGEVPQNAAKCRVSPTGWRGKRSGSALGAGV